MAAGKKITDEQMAVILQLVKLGVTPRRAAMSLGLSDAALSMRKKRNPQFGIELAAAEAKAETGLQAKMLDLAMKGNRQAIEFLLERRWPERWARTEYRENRNDEDDAPEPDQRYL